MKNGEKTHCPQGHPYDAANTYIWRGRRICRACRDAHIRRWQQNHGRERVGWRGDRQLLEIAAALRRAGRLIWGATA